LWAASFSPFSPASGVFLMWSDLDKPLLRAFLPDAPEGIEAGLDAHDARYFLRIGGRDWVSRLERVYATEALRDIADQLQAEGIRIQGCGNCVYFRHSGLSQQFSAGLIAYCGLAGLRYPDTTVRIDHGCGEFSPVEGWPHDPDVIDRHRRRVGDADPRPSRVNAFQGAILGLAIGDALGYPAEFLRRSQILNKFGPTGITDFVPAFDRHPPGTYTDDTQMTIAVAEGLLDPGSHDLESAMSAIGKRLIAWSKSRQNDRAPGRTCMEGIRRLESGIPWREAGVRESKGCGTAIRVAPLGLMFWRDTPRLLEMARASALLTHGHEAAIEGAASAALLVALALKKRTPQEMFNTVMKECAPRSKEFETCFEKVPALLSKDPEIVLSSNGLGLGWVSEEAVASALYCFWRNPLDYRQTVLTAANTDGDSDSIACIAGGISGAFNGLHALPASWVDEVENSTYLKELGGRLYRATGHHTLDA
jgi:ADP-ribosylglycohydrolase